MEVLLEVRLMPNCRLLNHQTKPEMNLTPSRSKRKVQNICIIKQEKLELAEEMFPKKKKKKKLKKCSKKIKQEKLYCNQTII